MYSPTLGAWSPASVICRVCGSRASSASAEASGSRIAGSTSRYAHDHKQRTVSNLASEEPQQQQRRLIRRVQVVEHQHQRLRLRGAFAGRSSRRSKSRKRAPSDSERRRLRKCRGTAREAPAAAERALPPRRRVGFAGPPARSHEHSCAATAPTASRPARRPPPSSGRRAPAPRARAPVRSAHRPAGSCRCRARRRPGTSRPAAGDASSRAATSSASSRSRPTNARSHRIRDGPSRPAPARRRVVTVDRLEGILTQDRLMELAESRDRARCPAPRPGRLRAAW